jgi:8-oxo-dGTP pyrophosphatase MutT (NUDIX family)
MKQDSVVGAFLVNTNKQILLVDHKIMQKWVPYGGHVDPYELPHETVLREGREELPGLEIKFLQISKPKNGEKGIPMHFNTRIHEMVPDNHTPYPHEHYCINYLCTNLTDSFTYNTDELNGFNWFNKQELKELDRIPNPLRELSLSALETGIEILNS